LKGFEFIDLFCGCGGLSEGFHNVGFKAIAANDNWKIAADTFKINHKLDPVIGSISEKGIYDQLVSAAKNVDLVVGGPPCQAFSTAGKRLSIKDPRGNLILDFVRFIMDTEPKAFVMENVRGILSAAVSHRPLHLRGNGVPLGKYEELGSALKFILNAFRKTGYRVTYGLLNSADYGVPQKRQRVFFLGAKNGEDIPLPQKTHSNGGMGGLPTWATLGDALNGLNDPNPEYPKYTERNANVFMMVPPGGYWRHLPEEMHKEVLGGAYRSNGGKVGFFRRLSFDKPSPTLVTSPIQKGTAMCHPVETRPLTVKEYARVQQFPDGWSYAGKMTDKYKQIGNAVPVDLAKAVAGSIKTYLTHTG